MRAVILAASLTVPVAAGAQTSGPIRLNPDSTLTTIAEAPRFAALFVSCGERERSWLDAVHRGVESAIAAEIRADRLPADREERFRALYWGAAAMGRMLGERAIPETRERCAEMARSPILARLDGFSRGEMAHRRGGR